MPFDQVLDPTNSWVYTYILYIYISMYLQRTATHCNTLQHTTTHCNTLQHTATHCNTQTFDQIFDPMDRNTLQHPATYCNTLQQSAAKCNNTETHCNILEHTAAHCNTQTFDQILDPMDRKGFIQPTYAFIHNTHIYIRFYT